MAAVSTVYALRSVRRNFRRTLLSVLGIGVGCALALFVDSVNRGKDELYVRTAAESGSGHLRVVPAGWRADRDPDLRLADGAADLAAARALPGIAVAVPRARAQALLAMGTHVVPVEMVGVDPALEPRAYRFVRRMSRGAYLAPGARVLEVGCGTARNLVRIGRKYPQARLYGLDASSAMLTTAERSLMAAGLAERAKLVRAYAEDLSPGLFGVSGFEAHSGALGP